MAVDGWIRSSCDYFSRNLMCHVTVLSIGDVLQPVKELIIKFKRSGYFRYFSNVGIILKKACKEGAEVLLIPKLLIIHIAKQIFRHR